MIAADIAAMIRAVGDAFPELRGAEIVVHDDGWDSIALEIGGEWICKFPRDGDGPAALKVEAGLIAALRPRLSMPIPEMTVIDGPPLFTRHRKIVGKALLAEDYAALSEDRRALLADDIAGFLAQLHAIDGDWAALGVDAVEGVPAGAVILTEVLPLLPPDLHAEARRICRRHATLEADPLGSGLCYLDAHGRNFAFDPRTGRLNGIFDFGDVAIAGRHAEFVEPAYVTRDFATRVIDRYEVLAEASIDRQRVETLIGMQCLVELAEDGADPKHAALIRWLAEDWLRAPTLNAA